MNKLFIFSLLLTYTCAVYGKSRQYADDSVFPTKMPISDACTKSASKALDGCKNSVKDKWMNSDLGKEMIEAGAKMDMKKMQELMPHLECCMAWEAFDCIKGGLGACTPADQKAAKEGFEKVTKTLESTTCASYKYHSGQCSGSASISANIFKLAMIVLAIIYVSNKLN